MPVLMRGKRVGVEQVKNSQATNTVVAMPEDSSAVGIIRFVGDSVVGNDLKVNTKVYFGKAHHQLRMNGMNILVMDEENVYAVVQD